MKLAQAFAAALLLTAGCGPRVTADAPRVRVSDAWARASAGAASAGAVYLTLQSERDDRLVAADVPPEVARFAQVHETVRAPVAGGASEVSMRHAAFVELPARRRVEFAPGRRHLMLLELAHPLAVGDSFTLVLRFARAQPETVRVPVRDE